MFPNDDICNVRAAKSAARRIFEKYGMKSQQPTQGKGLGQQQVSGLIKNAYSAINMAYDPSLNDVSSFMSVFGVGQNGTIELDRLQELAVKYLCGEEAFKVSSNNPEQKDIETKSAQKIESEVVNQTSNSKLVIEEKVHYQNPLQFKNTGNKQSPQISQSNGKNLGLKFLSPRAPQTNNFFSSKENTPTSPKGPIKEQLKTSKKPTYSEVLNYANEIFNQHKSKEKMGITIDQAPEVMAKTYRLIGKMKFMPSEEDVKIWMKLCDVRKNGAVEWVSYQNFVKRMMERQNILQVNQK